VKISVITVVRNGAETIEETIRSVARQSYPDTEHIVVDGASTDDTMTIVERYRNTISRAISEPDEGIYDAMNKGIGMASGDVIGFLNADDVYADSDVLSRVAEVFNDPKIEGVYGDLVYVDREDSRRVVRYWKSREYELGSFEKGWMPAHPTFFVRKRVYDRLGGFDLDYKIQSDFELTMRFIGIHGIKTRYLPFVMVRMRRGGMSNKNLRNVIRGNLEAYRACKKHGVDVSPLFILFKICSRIPQFFVTRTELRRGIE
jgi:glycosyltransferase involved in cell wall biosynthesis